MKKYGIIAGVVAFLLLLAGWLLPALSWDGGKWVQFQFRILDSGNMYPIRNARVRVVRDYELKYLSDTNAGSLRSVVTDTNGMATVSVMCGAGGSIGLFGKTGKFVISHELLVEADGYRPLSTALANVVGGRRWPLSKPGFEVDLVMFKNP